MKAEEGLNAKHVHMIGLRKEETEYSPSYIYRQIFGSLMRGHHQSWPDIHLDELRLISPGTVGRIHMEGSPINYPVVRGGENRAP